MTLLYVCLETISEGLLKKYPKLFFVKFLEESWNSVKISRERVFPPIPSRILPRTSPHISENS